MKRTFSTELAYPAGIVILAMGTALMEKADLGMSMVVAPAYLLHLKLSQSLPWFTFGAAEYTLQAVLLVVMVLSLRRFKPSYLFSFLTAVFYGIVLDACLALAAPIPGHIVLVRGVCFLGGMVLCSLGVAFLFHTYIAPEVYELFVKELSGKYGWEISRVKTCYDCVSCGVGILLSFAFFGFGHFEGIKGGTIFCALVNGWLIGRCGALYEKCFRFEDRFGWRKYF